MRKNKLLSLFRTVWLTADMQDKNERMFIAPRDMVVKFKVEYKNVNTTYGIRLYNNRGRLDDVHGAKDSTWHTYERECVLNAGDYLRTIMYNYIYWRNLRLEEVT